MDNYIELLKKFVAFKSISTDPQFQDQLTACSEWLVNLFKENNFRVEVITDYGNPIIIANYTVNPDYKNALVYGHYDVQPADINEGWQQDPFTLLEHEGKLIGRGSMDNKGQVLIHMVTIFKLIKENNLRYNIKFLLEGTEEIGSEGIEDFIKNNKEKLNADFLLLSDSGLVNNQATIEAGLRGVINIGVKVKTSNHEVHSGVFGGAMPNAATELVLLLQKLLGENGWIKTTEFYEDLDDIETELLHRNLKSDEELMKITGTKKIFHYNSEMGMDFYTQTGRYPSIEVTTLKSGYMGEGFKNSIPFESEAKLNVRTALSQDPQEIYNLITGFLKDRAPEYIDLEFHMDALLPAVEINLDNEYAQNTKRILEQIYGNEPIIHYTGGSLPLIKYLQDILKIPILSIPLVNEGHNMHGANENFDIEFIKKGIGFSTKFFSNLTDNS